MDSLSIRLRNRIDVYGKKPITNELDEEDFEFGKIKSIWSEIIPTGGSLKTGEGNTIYASVTHKITVRSKAIPNLTNDMYFMYKGQRFDINFFQLHYKFNDCIEIMCNLVVQNPNDLGENYNG